MRSPKRVGLCTPSVSSSNQDVSNVKQIVFTLHDGKLLVSPKDNPANNDLSTDSVCCTISTRGIADEDEVHIEIFRENDLKSGSIQVEDEAIVSISSAYEAFWKTDFQECMERRTCGKCNQVFLTPQQLLHHLQDLHQISIPEKVSQCFVCHKLFTDKVERNEHLLHTHQIDRPHCTCEVCFQAFENESEKNAHILLHSATDKCKWCSESFPCKYLLSHHHQQCLLRRTDQDCYICGCQFRSSQMQSLHSLRHNRLACEICNFNLLPASNLHVEGIEITFIRHLKSIHSTDEIKNYLQVLKKQDEDEELLDKLLLSHVQTNLTHLNDPCVSSNSNHIQPTDQPENVVSKEVRLENDITEPTILSLQCSECLKFFDNKEELVKHDVEHQRPFSCHICKLKFSIQRGYKAHMRSHGVEVKPDSIRYKCKYCPVSCSTLSSFRIHLLTHTDQKPHLCDKCGLKFRRPHTLKVHEQHAHSSRSADSCPYCGMSSFSKKSLLRHIQCVHEGVRRFICGLCAIRCLQNQDLRRHLKSVHKLDLPPLKSVLKKSNMQVHVIPSADSLDPTDPLADLLKFAVKDEESKLEALRQRSEENDFRSENNKCVLRSENCVEEGQSLSILGDVASKAVPLEHASTISETFKTCTDLKVQEAIKYFCVGCQYASDSLQNISTHLVQCQQGKTLLSDPEKYLNFVSTADPLSVYSVPSSSSNIPCQYYFLPTHNTTSDLQLELGLFNNLNSLTCPVMPSLNVESTFSSNVVSSSIPVNTNNNGSGETAAAEDPTAILGTNSLLSSRPPEVDFLCPSNMSFQEALLAGAEREAGVIDKVIINSQNQHEYHENQDFVQTEKSLISHDSEKMSSLAQTSNAALQSVQNIIQSEKMQTSDQNSESKSLYDSSDIVTSEDFAEFTVPRNEKTVKTVPSKKKRTLPSQNFAEIDLEDKMLVHDASRSAQDRHTNNSNLISDIYLPKSDNSPPDPKVYFKTNLLGVRNASDDMKICPICKKKFSNARSLQRHAAAHSGEKLHECTYCGKHFQYKFNLTVHLRCHSGDRPYKCTTCLKNFRYLAELKEHKLLHENSHPFKCEKCEQSFTRKRDLRRHSYSHNESQIKPTCHICQKSYSRPDYLQRHIREHRRLGEIEYYQASKDPNDPSVEPEDIILYTNTKEAAENPSSLNETLFVCELCSSHFVSESERTEHQKNCGGSSDLHQVAPIPFEISSKTNEVSSHHTTTVPSNSDDLISLAYQAAEDGVEFMFVEEINNLSQTQNNPNPSEIGTDNNVIYVQVIEPDESNAIG